MLIRRRPPRLLSFRLFALSSSSSSSCRPRPYSLPLLKSQIPKNIPFAVSAVGKTWDDPYRWISKTDDPDLIDFLHRENSYAEAFMADTKHLQERLVAEMKARMLPKVTTPPESWGDWVFCTNLASNMADDLLFTVNDMSCCMDITNTKDGKFITINSNSRGSSEVYVMNAANLKDGLWPVRECVPGYCFTGSGHYLS